MTITTPQAADGEQFLGGGGIAPGWRAVMSAMLALAFGPSVILLMSFGVFAPALHNAFGWGVGEISLGATIISLAIMLLSPLQGLLVDRFGGRAVVLTSLPLFALGLFALGAMTGDIRQFYLGCFVVPFLAVGTWPLSYLKLASTWFDRRLGLALGITNVGVGVGAALVPVLIGTLLAVGGWRMAYAGLGAVVLLIAWPLAAIFLRGNPTGAVAAKRRAASADLVGLRLPAVLKTASFWLLTASFFILGIISSGILVHQVGILTAHGLTVEAAIGLQSALGLASIVGRVAAGWLLDRIRVSWLMAVVMVAAAGACVLYASPATGGVLIVGAAIFGFAIGAEFDALGFAIRRYYGLKAFGIVFGLIFSAFQLGASIGVAGMGVGLARTGSYASGLMVFAVLCLIGTATFLALRGYRYGADGRLLDGAEIRPAPALVSEGPQA